MASPRVASGSPDNKSPSFNISRNQARAVVIVARLFGGFKVCPLTDVEVSQSIK